jgi:hypothetical protein
LSVEGGFALAVVVLLASAACGPVQRTALGVQACDDAHACRQDYVCTRTRQHALGACLPPYFVVQLRLDGYPLKY